MKRDVHNSTEGEEYNNITILEMHTNFNIPSWLDMETIARFIHENMKPYEDTLEDTRRSLEFSLSIEPGKGGFVLLAMREQRLLGVVVVLNTGMGGYVPANLLLFAAVDSIIRNKGVGGLLITDAIRRTGGDIKVHCEYGNPALRLYERLGFKSNYAELRYTREESV